MTACWNGSHVVINDDEWLTKEEYETRHKRGDKGYETAFKYLPDCPEPPSAPSLGF